MRAQIFYEPGVKSNYIDAAKLAYDTLGNVTGESTKVTVQELDFTLPSLTNGQIDSEIIENISTDRGNSILIVTRRDLGAIGLNYCFGRSAHEQHSAIVSSHRLDYKTMVGLTIHELGHSAGSVSEQSPQYNRDSHFVGHCANECVMEPVNNLTEMNATVEKIMAHPHTAGFCIECAQDLALNL